MSTKVVQVGDMEGEEMKILAKRNGEADGVRDSLFSGIFTDGNTLLTARILCLEHHVCFLQAIENFTTICVSNGFCRSSAKNHSGVRHFRETTDQTRFEPETSRLD